MLFWGAVPSCGPFLSVVVPLKVLLLGVLVVLAFFGDLGHLVIFPVFLPGLLHLLSLCSLCSPPGRLKDGADYRPLLKAAQVALQRALL